MKSERLILALDAAFKAGDKIMEVYKSDNFEIENKLDNSPLTIADRPFSQNHFQDFDKNRVAFDF